MNVSYRQIVSASNRQESKLFVEAYLRLFNDPKNLPFLSVTGIPFKRETVETWLREADTSGIEYHVALGRTVASTRLWSSANILWTRLKCSVSS
jgi:hypothetical protein